MKHPSIHALIIGGGIAGPALSLFLKKAGISSTVYEAYPYMQGVGGGLNLAPNGMNVLAEVGLSEEVKARGTVALEMCFRSETGRVLARIDNGSKKYGQPALTDVNHTSDHKKVVVRFADGSCAEGDILIGADGIHSQTRPVASLHPIICQGKTMAHELGSGALRDLREQIARENNPERLRELVVNINVLLILIEDQVTKIEKQQPPSRN